MALFKRIETIIDAEQFLLWNDPPRGVKIHPHTGLYYVTTIQGIDVPVALGEWIVVENDGLHHYPIADEVFKKTYTQLYAF